MRVYHVSESGDEAEYGPFYQRCRATEGVRYIGSLPQPELARELRSAAVLAYPNIFPETFCIAALEALASGCWVVTSDLGALAETTAGFASLIPVEGQPESYAQRFVAETSRVLRDLNSPAAETIEGHLRRQVDHVRRYGTWSLQAKHWASWLTIIAARPGARPFARG
jgi:glycosyltransferase involved in cell wall biosynthesis